MKKELFKYVHELLSQKEHIIVPNFGAFVLQKTTTFLNDGEYISIIFSAQQQNDDKVLSTYISEKNACSIEEADEFIEQTLESIYSEIEQKGTYKIEGIGEFRAINERIVFKPFDDQFILKEIVEEVKKTEPVVEVKAPETPVIPVTPPTASTPPTAVIEEKKVEEKVDIETIRQTYAERTHQAKKEEETKKEEKPVVQEKTVVEEKVTSEEPAVKKEKTPVDFSKYRTPIIIVVIIALLGITGYVFRTEIASLCKPTQTNDTTSVITQQNMNQLADTLQEIQNTPENTITEETPISSTPAEEQSTASAEPAYTEPTNVDQSVVSIESAPVVASPKTYYANTNETKYYVTKASYARSTEAAAEKNNLDHTGFIASIVETDGAKKYHVVVAEFTTLAEAEKELNFAKQIDKRFYLMTVKPRNK